MKVFRLLLAILLSLTVPFAATAGVATSSGAAMRPMQQMAAGHMVGMSMHDCCQDGHAQHGASDHSCKPGQLCKASSAYNAVPASVEFRPAPATRQSIAASPACMVPSRDLRGFWRPPRSL